MRYCFGYINIGSCFYLNHAASTGKDNPAAAGTLQSGKHDFCKTFGVPIACAAEADADWRRSVREKTKEIGRRLPLHAALEQPVSGDMMERRPIRRHRNRRWAIAVEDDCAIVVELHQGVHVS